MNQNEAAEYLRKLLPPGATVYTTLKHVSRSGMLRVIDLHAIVDGQPVWLSGAAAIAFGWKRDKNREGIRVSGCGMDMGFQLAYEMSARLYPDGVLCTGEGCLSNDHSNGDRDYTPHEHKDGGYALRHRWL